MLLKAATLRRALAVALMLSLTSCMMWRPSELSRITPEDAPDRVRVTKVDSTAVELAYPVVRSGAIVGAGEDGALVRVPLEEIQTLESWEVDPGFLFVPAIGAFLLLLANFPLDDPPTSGVTTDGP